MPAKPADGLFWKLDGALLNALGFVALGAGVACVGWAALLLLMQILGWIKAGEWQPVPLFALFMSDAAQADLRMYLVNPQPLALVPSWGGALGAEEIASQMAGQLMGMRKVLAWVLECPLLGALLLAGLAFFMAAGAAFNSATEGRS